MTTPEQTAELPAQYDPTATEAETYRRWMESGVFTARSARSDRVGGERPPFVITMPPPNVTGVLHMGHGLNNTVQDVIIRWRRMCGDEALWVPGTDHAGIATQNVVEKQLAREGITRFDLGREAFVARTHAWVENTGGTILRQLRAIGASADWTRTAYTLDEGPSRAVREAFVRLYDDGLIYRGHRVIHWCSRCLTSLSDEEAEHAEESGKLYHISYLLAGADAAGRSLTVATTRPETMLGDVAVAVNPADDRYRDLVGRMVVLPIANIEIPIIADEYADPAFGTGVVKITPAHDPNDFEVGRRHSLPMPIVLTPDGRMAEWADAADRIPESLRSLERLAARNRIVQMLTDSGRLVKTEAHQHSVRHCYRCDTVVEPRLSDQWFVRMEPLARPALEAVRTGQVRILPERWEAVYVNWLEGIRDWNISRQLWWGHRIPVWYCDGCRKVTASRTDVTECARCKGPLRQDEDVLDTWFSSWLWPFSTLGWPDREADDLRAFYPTDALVTAPEILFFWVARMVMAGCYFAGDAPFHTVYLTGTARDTDHVRMQKSLGNGIDPLDVVERFGADALRFTVVSGLGIGADIILDPQDLERSFAPGRNFATKLWNIGRYLLSNVGSETAEPVAALKASDLTRADHWILARLDAAVRECDAALGPARPGRAGATDHVRALWHEPQRRSGLRLDEFAETARRFMWNELADWYLEAVKGRLADESRSGSRDREVARSVLVHVFDRGLRLLHPIVPFITEALWQMLPLQRDVNDFLATASWPRARLLAGDALASDFELVREAVSAIRQVRSEYALARSATVAVTTVPSGRSKRARGTLSAERELVGRLTQAKLTVSRHAPSGAAAHSVLSEGTEVIIPLADLVDVEKECARFRGELEQLLAQIAKLDDRLRNPDFTGRAPAHVVDGEREKLRQWNARREQLAVKVKALCGV
ncbi:MAG: valine--tRNA ligase [Gemmatimonadaceae bacterium]